MASRSAIDILKRFLLSFRRNWGLKLISLLFALILWNYVIMEVDPYSTKTISVAVTPIGLTQLKNNNLTIKGNITKDIKNVDVAVELRRSEAASFNSNNVQVTADFSNITHEGKVDIILKTTTTRPGTVSVKVVTPPTISVEIEKRAIRNVPVSCKFINDIPGGYWRSEAEFIKTLQITGATSVITNVARAEVVFDLSGVTASLSRALDYTLYDNENNVITDTAGLLEYTPNDIVNVTVLPTKTVTIDARGSLIGEVAKGYEVISADSDPKSIVIVGPAETIQGITALKTKAVNIDGLSSTMSYTTDVKLPSGVRVAVPGSDSVEVAVTVREKTVTKTLSNLPVLVTGLGTGLKIEPKFYADSVVITCPELDASSIRSSKIRLFVDATGLDAGAHTLTIYYELAEELDPSKIKVEIKPTEIAVQIKPSTTP